MFRLRQECLAISGRCRRSSSIEDVELRRWQTAQLSEFFRDSANISEGISSKYYRPLPILIRNRYSCECQFLK